MRLFKNKERKQITNQEQTYDSPMSVEVIANQYTLKCLNYAIGVTILVWIANILNIFIVEQRLMSTASVIGLIFLIAPKIIAKWAGMDAPWLKYVILFFTSTAIAIYGIALSYHAVLLFVLPLFFAAQYQSRKVMYITYSYVLVSMLFSVVCSFWLGLCDMNMLLLSAFPMNHYANIETGELFNLTVNQNPWITVPLFFFVPRAMILLLFIPILNNLVDMSASNALMMADLQRLSETDKATRFYNKNKFDQMISNYYPHVDRVGVIFWDLNNLKTVNDNYGHTQGDIIISSLAGCISETVMNMRHVYRVGGDEFVMIVEDPRPDELTQIVNDVKGRMEQHNVASRIPISAAVGWAEGAGKSIVSVIDEADRKMYIDKGAKKAIPAPENLKDSILADRLFEGLASVSDNIYIFIYDLRTHISRWSDSAVEYFDLPSEYMKDAKNVWYHRIHPEDRALFTEELDRILNGQSVVHRAEYRAMNRHGEYVWVECRGNVIYDEERQTRYFSGIILRLDNRNKYDSLTKLKTLYEFNKFSFEDRTGSLLLIGLDDFRMIVNNFGYAYGDIVLMEFAQRLMNMCGTSKIPFRMEGDEFLILYPGGDEADTRKLFYDIRSLCFGLGKKASRLVNVKFSGGAVLFPANGSNREELLSNLEHSLELAKGEHRGELVFFKDDIATAHQQNQIVKERIARISREGFKGFTLNFQPLVRSSDHRIVSCEALLRCEELSRQGIQIVDVIEYLERSGEILAMGRFVATQVFQRAQIWQKQFKDLNIGFNVSAVQLQDSTFVSWLIRLAEKYNVDPKRITIEITESSQVEDYVTTALYLEELRNHGFKIALDDFGIAYSTLMLIKTLPTDYVKIDHSFVLHLHQDTDKKDLTIVESVIDLCRKLNIQVVAEGVENAEILNILDRYPIALYQGYYFSRPLSEADFVNRLKANTVAENHE